MSVQSIISQTPTRLATIPPSPKKHYPWPAVASFFIPGTGQFIKGDKKKGTRDLGIYIGSFIAAFLGVAAVVPSMLKSMSKEAFGESSRDFMSLKRKNIGLGVFLSFVGIASIANTIHSAYDAYKAEPPQKS